MKRVIWLGESKVIPGHGMAIHGQHMLLPETTANSYISQGLAEPEKPLPKAKMSTTQEGEL